MTQRHIRKFAFLLGAVVLLASVGIAFILHKISPKPKTQAPKVNPSVVLIQKAAKEDIPLKVQTQGTVQPRTETTLTAEVSGKVLNVAPFFYAGGFFSKDDVLLQIDPRDYETAVITAKAEVARAEAALAMEKAEAEQAVKDWEKLGDGEEPPPLVLRKPQLQQAEAAVESARGALQRAENDLARTIIRAPYDGRVRKKLVDVGQYISTGTQLANVYAIDYAEIRLPLSDEQLANLDLPLTYRGEGEDWEDGIPVTFRAALAGKEHEWKGKIVRTEGEVDSQTRLLYAVARVDDPYGRNGKTAPLAAGMFVKASIMGKTVPNGVKIPRGALHGRNTVYVADAENKLRLRKVNVASFQNGSVVLRSGLEDGDRVIVSPLSIVVDGMLVEPKEEEN